MAKQKTLKASNIITANSPQGQEITTIFQAQLNKACLNIKRAHRLIGNSTFAVRVQALIQQCSTLVQSPEGGRIHTLRILVDPARDWQVAINAAGPNTGADWDVRKVGHLYPPQHGAPKKEDVTLVNFGKTIPNTQYALDWGAQYGLVTKDPRTVFAIGEHKPQLHTELGLKTMVVVAPTPCAFDGGQQVPGVWWDDARRRGTGLYWLGDEWDDRFWFAFGCEEGLVH